MNQQQLAVSTAEEAYNLWTECHEYRLRQIEFLYLREIRSEEEKLKFQIVPIPKKYPFGFDEYLRLIMPGKGRRFRIRIYREYVAELIWSSHVSQIKYPQSAHQRIAQAVMTTGDAEKLAKPASEEEINDWMQHDAGRVFENQEFYQLDASHFLKWLSKYKANIRKKRAQAGAEALKRQRQKNG